jgi:hypothetical protein
MKDNGVHKRTCYVYGLFYVQEKLSILASCLEDRQDAYKETFLPSQLALRDAAKLRCCFASKFT